MFSLSAFTRAIQSDPNYGPAYIGRGNLLRVQGQYQQALDDLSIAIRLTPESAEALHARGLLNQRQGLFQGVGSIRHLGLGCLEVLPHPRFASSASHPKVVRVTRRRWLRAATRVGPGSLRDGELY